MKRHTSDLKVFIWLFAAVFAIASWHPIQSARAAHSLYSGRPAKYVFMFIGDGMGIPQRSAAEAYTGKRLLTDKFPAQGITTTKAADHFITGSAASALAASKTRLTRERIPKISRETPLI